MIGSAFGANALGRTVALGFSLAAVFMTLSLEPARAASKAEGAAPVCTAPEELLRLTFPLERVKGRLKDGRPVKIVAFGSSSTYGYGASSPVASYPARLEAELRKLFPRQQITVINRGINGNQTREELARMERDVLAENPDLVIWQLGTNELVSGRDVRTVPADLSKGLKRLKAMKIDAVVMNMQFASRITGHPGLEHLRHAIARASAHEGVNTFDRYAIMKSWMEEQGYPEQQFLQGDLLHPNDWSYDCMAHLIVTMLQGSSTAISSRVP